ncbi:hypothetical protein Emed_007494 [Eimeria media]
MAQAVQLTNKIRASKAKVLDLKNPPGGPANIDHILLEAELMEGARYISEGLSAEYAPTVPQSVQQALQEELQDLIAATTASIAVLTEMWTEIMELRESLLQSSYQDVLDYANQHSPQNPPQPSSPVVDEIMELSGRVAVARELVKDLGRFTQFPFQESPLTKPLENLQARVSEVEQGMRNVVENLLGFWRTRLNMLRQGVSTGTRSQEELKEAEDDASAFEKAIRDVSGLNVTLE